MRISILVALTPQRVIGYRGALPWHLPADLAHFKRTTMGHHIIMGRKTYQSLGRPLPGRSLIVLTRHPRPEWQHVHQVRDLEQALTTAAGDDEVFVVGGEQVYRLALPRADRLYQTIVHADLPGDTYFPATTTGSWELVDRRQRAADQRNPHDMTFEVWDRRPVTND